MKVLHWTECLRRLLDETGPFGGRGGAIYLAHELGAPLCTVRNWLQGRFLPSARYRQKLWATCKKYGVDKDPPADQ